MKKKKKNIIKIKSKKAAIIIILLPNLKDKENRMHKILKKHLFKIFLQINSLNKVKST
jgi:hypothetical protein